MRSYLDLAEIRLTVDRPAEAYTMAVDALRAGGGEAPAQRWAHAVGVEGQSAPPFEADADDADGQQGQLDAGAALTIMAEARGADVRHIEAARLAALALRLAPRAARSYRALGAALHAVDDSRALAVYETAVELDPHHSRARVVLGSLMRADPLRLKEAIAQLQTALKINRTDVEAMEMLEVLVEKHRRLSNPPRVWWREGLNLLAIIGFVLILTHFTMPDEVNAPARRRPRPQTARDYPY